ncbi:MAG: peptidylprolyl isomerase [Alphaproteobacteria bacterium]|nr:peptidylprolyl isomerase [Alphaproteobacteria bacterium]
MVMNALNKKASGGLGKFILFGFLALAVGGLVFSDVTGVFRGGVGSSDVARIGDEKLSIHRFDRSLRRTLAQTGLSVDQAYKLGYVGQFLNSEIQRRVLFQAAARDNMRIDQKILAGEIMNLLAPMTGEGQKPEDVLQAVLLNQGMSEGELVDSIRRDMTNSIFSKALVGGMSGVSKAFVKDMAAFGGETRSIEYVAFKDADFKDVQKPGEEQLKTFYETTKDAYAVPEMRSGKLIILNTASLDETMEISEDDLKSEYDANIAAYTYPEMRTIEQVILASADRAKAVADKVKGGTSLKEAVKDVTGNVTDYLPPQDVKEEDLLEDLQADVFNAESGDMIGPIETALGQQIVVVKGIKAAHTDGFKSVRGDLEKELRVTRLSDARFAMADQLDDLLAGGAGPDEIKQELSVEIKDLPAASRYGQDKNAQAVLGDMGEYKPQYLENLFELNEGESSSVAEMPDGRLAAVYLDSILPKSFPSFEEVKSKLEAEWMEDQRRVSNAAFVDEKLNAVQGGEKLSDLGVIKILESVERSKKLPEPLISQSLAEIFEAPVSEAFVLPIDGGRAIARVTASHLGKASSDEALQQLTDGLVSSGQNETLGLYLDAISQSIPATINQPLIDRVYGSQDQ